MFHFSDPGGGHSGTYITKVLNSEYSENCENKCFGGLHVYFRNEARKVSSAILLNLLQLVIWPEIVSFCPNSSNFSLISCYFVAKSCPSVAKMDLHFGAASDLPSRTTDFDHLINQIYM